MTIDEAAGVLGISSRTGYRNWQFARAWLFRRLPERITVPRMNNDGEYPVDVLCFTSEQRAAPRISVQGRVQGLFTPLRQMSPQNCS